MKRVIPSDSEAHVKRDHELTNQRTMLAMMLWLDAAHGLEKAKAALADTTKRYAVELANHGASLAEIGRALGVTRSRAGQILGKHPNVAGVKYGAPKKGNK